MRFRTSPELSGRPRAPPASALRTSAFVDMFAIGAKPGVCSTHGQVMGGRMEMSQHDGDRTQAIGTRSRPRIHGRPALLAIAAAAVVALTAAVQPAGGSVIRTALPPLQVAKPLAQITAVAPASYDKFGSAVALSGGTCLVGAPLKALAEAPQVGAAYIFVGGERTGLSRRC